MKIHCTIVGLASWSLVKGVDGFTTTPSARRSISPGLISSDSRRSVTNNRISQPLQVATIDVVQEDSTALLETTSNEKERTYLDDGFVFGLEGSGIERPKGKEALIVVEGDSLETKPYQVAMVLGTFLGHGWFLTNSFQQILMGNGGNVALTTIQSVLLFISSWIAADLGSGVLHWSVDNYGNGRTPVMGSIIAAFQGHHTAPWTITQRGFCNNVYKLCIPFGIVTMSMINFISGPATTFFFAVFCMMEILSQEFHKWSHQTKTQCPAWINALQSLGLTIDKRSHGMHHLAPFDGNYCIVSGLCNKPLDESGFFRRLELMVYKWNGVESNAWKLDSKLRERTLAGDYSLPTRGKNKERKQQEEMNVEQLTNFYDS